MNEETKKQTKLIYHGDRQTTTVVTEGEMSAQCVRRLVDAITLSPYLHAGGEASGDLYLEKRGNAWVAQDADIFRENDDPNWSEGVEDGPTSFDLDWLKAKPQRYLYLAIESVWLCSTENGRHVWQARKRGGLEPYGGHWAEEEEQNGDD